MIKLVDQAGLTLKQCNQTIFGLPGKNRKDLHVDEGFGEGAFVAICAIKKGDK